MAVNRAARGLCWAPELLQRSWARNEAVLPNRCAGNFERYRDADAAIEHLSNIGHLMKPIRATACVTGDVLGTPAARKGGPKLFTPWMALQDQELARED